MGAAPSGSPGCPEFADCTASIARPRIVLIDNVSTEGLAAATKAGPPGRTSVAESRKNRLIGAALDSDGSFVRGRRTEDRPSAPKRPAVAAGKTTVIKTARSS